MLTRIEISGFKTFAGFELDFCPFLVVIGPDAAGKSNQFDAIQLLARLGGTDLNDAVRGLRGGPRELFRRTGERGTATRIDLAAEVLLPPSVSDPWNGQVVLSHTRLRYEVAIERRADDRGRERLYVVHEQALPIWHRDDGWRPGGQAPSAAFQRTNMLYRRRPPFLETVSEGDATRFAIHHDGQSGRTRSARAAEATVLSSITSTEFPHLYALRKEMRSWSLLQLEPAAMRQPSPASAPDVLEPSGANLAAVLGRIQTETATEEHEAGLLGDIEADLGLVVGRPVKVLVEEDEYRHEHRLYVGLGGEAPHSSMVASDGLLRALALLTALHDPRHGAVICIEEPENGLQPAWLRRVLDRLRAASTDPQAEGDDPDRTLAQVLMNCQSPIALPELDDGEMVFAEMTPAITDAAAGGSGSRRTVMRPVAATDQGTLELGDEARPLTRFEVERLLSSVT
jgi:predicted ATPase